MSKLESYELATVNRGLCLRCDLGSPYWANTVLEARGSNIHDPYAFAVGEIDDTPIDNDAALIDEKFHG